MMSRTGGQYSRKDYDSNPFYFRLGRFTEGDSYSCQYTPRKMFASLESSNNGYDNLQVWTTTAKLNGDKYDISGSVTTTYANENNYFNVLPFASSNTTTEAECPSHFYAATLLQDDKVTMNGSVSATSAEINWYFIDADLGWSVTGTFSGQAWDGGAKLDFSSNSPTPVTTGEAKRVNCDNCESETYVEKHEKSIIAGTVVGGVVFLSVIGVGAFFIWQWWSKRHYNAARQVDHDDAFAMDDHHDERDMKDGTASGLRPIPSEQNLLPGHGVDTSYDAHRSPSPDPTAPGLPAYSDNYTPLR
ncbi:hypothetical protein, variant [Verruconis gallopava]|nr:hypothetical protein, variant [Verruconis gallopava]KIW02442.1 hypothetical protein, variant [Verruconis gallopava]